LLPFGPEPSVFSVAVEELKIRIYKTIILPVVLYECESWSLTLREEHRLGVFENRVLRRIFGGYKVTREWRKLHNEEVHDLHSEKTCFNAIFSTTNPTLLTRTGSRRLTA
jgi:hypothetical protein